MTEEEKIEFNNGCVEIVEDFGKVSMDNMKSLGMVPLLILMVSPLSERRVEGKGVAILMSAYAEACKKNNNPALSYGLDFLKENFFNEKSVSDYVVTTDINSSGTEMVDEQKLNV